MSIIEARRRTLELINHEKFYSGFLVSIEHSHLAPLSIVCLTLDKRLSIKTCMKAIRKALDKEFYDADDILICLERMPDEAWGLKDGLELIRHFYSSNQCLKSFLAKERFNLLRAKVENNFGNVVDMRNSLLFLQKEYYKPSIASCERRNILLRIIAAYSEFCPLADIHYADGLFESVFEADSRYMRDSCMAFMAGYFFLRSSRPDRARDWFLKVIRSADSTKAQQSIYLRGLAGMLARDYSRSSVLGYCTPLDSVRNNLYPSLPLWTGYRDCSVLLYREQGPGEEIFFLRLLLLLKGLYPTVTFTVQVSKRLRNAARVCIPGIEFFTDGDEADGLLIDCVCPLSQVLVAIDKQFKRKPERVDAALESAPSRDLATICKPLKLTHGANPWRKSGNGTRVGVVWRSRGSIYGSNKTVGFELVEALSRVSGLQVVSFQHDMSLDERNKCQDSNVEICSDVDNKEDWSLLPEQLKQLDYFVGCSTTLAHFAASLGIRTKVLINKGHAVNFMWNRNAFGESDWYPNAYVYEKRDDGCWTSTISTVVKDLVHEMQDYKASGQ